MKPKFYVVTRSYESVVVAFNEDEALATSCDDDEPRETVRQLNPETEELPYLWHSGCQPWLSDNVIGSQNKVTHKCESCGHKEELVEYEDLDIEDLIKRGLVETS